MYEQFFRLKQRPFPAVANPRDYVPVEGMETARQRLHRAIVRGEGPALVVGPPGTGKTLLLRVLAEQCRSQFEVVFLPHGRFPSPRALLQAILFELKQPFRGMEDGELRLVLVEYLTAPDRDRATVLLVDEAETLNLRSLETLRGLTNLVLQDEAAVRLVLAGLPELEERLTSPKLQILNQRIAVRCYLDALNRAETFAYIRGLLSHAGADAARIFPDATCQAVYHASGGVPRLINQICDHALILAFADGQKEVTPQLVQEAWSDLQQIPLPWDNSVPQPAPAHSVVEFGNLSEEKDSSWADDPPHTSGCSSVARDENAEAHGFGYRESANPTAADSPYAEFPGSIAPMPEGLEKGEDDFASGGGRSSCLATDKDPSICDEHTLGCSEAGCREDCSALSGRRALVPIRSLASEAGCSEDCSPRSVENDQLVNGLSPDPVAKLEKIEAAVRELQADPPPKVAKKPEVEVVFYDWGDPFEEPFAETIPVPSRVPMGWTEDAMDFDGGPEELDTELSPGCAESCDLTAKNGPRPAAGQSDKADSEPDRSEKDDASLGKRAESRSQHGDLMQSLFTRLRKSG